MMPTYDFALHLGGTAPIGKALEGLLIDEDQRSAEADKPTLKDPASFNSRRLRTAQNGTKHQGIPKVDKGLGSRSGDPRGQDGLLHYFRGIFRGSLSLPHMREPLANIPNIMMDSLIGQPDYRKALDRAVDALGSLMATCIHKAAEQAGGEYLSPLWESSDVVAGASCTDSGILIRDLGTAGMVILQPKLVISEDTIVQTAERYSLSHESCALLGRHMAASCWLGIVVCCENPVIPVPSPETQGETISGFAIPEIEVLLCSLFKWLENDCKVAVIVAGGTNFSFKTVIHDQLTGSSITQICTGTLSGFASGIASTQETAALLPSRYLVDHCCYNPDQAFQSFVEVKLVLEPGFSVAQSNVVQTGLVTGQLSDKTDKKTVRLLLGPLLGKLSIENNMGSLNVVVEVDQPATLKCKLTDVMTLIVIEETLEISQAKRPTSFQFSNCIPVGRR